MLICLLQIFFLTVQAQVRVQADEVDFNSASQNGITVISTYGESIVGEEALNGVIIVHGFYSGIQPDTSTAVKDLLPVPGLKVFPNPARDQLILSSDDKDHPAYSVLLMAGDRIILTQPWRQQELNLTINLTIYPVGLYNITVRDEKSGRQSTMQIAKQ